MCRRPLVNRRCWGIHRFGVVGRYARCSCTECRCHACGPGWSLVARGHRRRDDLARTRPHADHRAHRAIDGRGWQGRHHRGLEHRVADSDAPLCRLCGGESGDHLLRAKRSSGVARRRCPRRRHQSRLRAHQPPSCCGSRSSRTSRSFVAVARAQRRRSIGNAGTCSRPRQRDARFRVPREQTIPRQRCRAEPVATTRAPRSIYAVSAPSSAAQNG